MTTNQKNNNTQEFDRSKFTVKGLKGHDTHDGYAYVCSFYYAGTRIAHVQHDGMGGEAIVSPVNKKTKQVLNDIEKWLQTLPPLKTEHFEISWNLDLLLDELVIEERTRRDLKRLCRNKIVFAEARQGVTADTYLKNHDWYYYKNTRWNAGNKRKVLEMEGSDIFILNDMFKPIDLDKEPA